MKTCRYIGNEEIIYLIKNNLYYYVINDSLGIIYDVDTKKLINVFTKEHFEKFFEENLIDTQVERKLKLEKLNAKKKM